MGADHKLLGDGKLVSVLTVSSSDPAQTPLAWLPSRSSSSGGCQSGKGGTLGSAQPRHEVDSGSDTHHLIFRHQIALVLGTTSAMTARKLDCGGEWNSQLPLRPGLHNGLLIF